MTRAPCNGATLQESPWLVWTDIRLDRGTIHRVGHAQSVAAIDLFLGPGRLAILLDGLIAIREFAGFPLR